MDIHPFVMEIVETLSSAGYVSYLAGGSVRDHLLALPETDVDIATSAPPEKVASLFPKTVSVGASFGVVVVVGSEMSVEVASFRRDGLYINGRSPETVEFSTAEEDALRRDFTINGMFYDPIKEQVIDFVGGREDLEKGVIRGIGDPFARFKEDRLRMVRAVRFSIRFNFPIEKRTVQAIKKYAGSLLPAVSMERIWSELKAMRGDEKFDQALLLLHDLGLLQVIFPDLKYLGASDLKKHLASFSHFSEKIPTILFVQELFPKRNREEREKICRYLKGTGEEISLSKLLVEVEDLMERESVEQVEWVRLYAKKGSFLCIEVVAVRREMFELVALHRKERERLKRFVKRVEKRSPVVSSDLLKREGVSQGKLMGKILREGERISVNMESEDPEEVLSILKSGDCWPRG